MTKHGVTIRSGICAGALLAFSLWLSAGTEQVLAQASGPFPTGARDLSAVWWLRAYDPRIRPADGGALPFTPEGEALYRENVEGLRAGTLEDHSRVWCSPDGLPRIWAQPYPFRIVQTPGQTTIIYERNGIFRTVNMKQSMPDELDLFPYFMGNAHGHWDADTLVVETAGFKAATFLDDTGVPQTYRLRTTERLRKISDNQLEVIVTIDDPGVFTRPWDAIFVFERRDDIRHFDFWVCGEDHRDISQMNGAPQ